MAIPTPPADASGGIIILKNTNGTHTHRMRFHVAPFNADATGSYTVTAGGLETGIAQTVPNLTALLKPIWNNTWTLTLDAVYRMVGGVLTEIFTVTPPAGVVGTAASSPGKYEEYIALTLRTSGGGKFRLFALEPDGWSYTAPVRATPSDGGGVMARLAYYLTGSAATGTTNLTQVVGHDGNKLTGQFGEVWGINRKLRRKIGDA